METEFIPRVDDATVLARARAALEEVFGPRLDRLILFGSRARGDARPDSDWDVAVVLTTSFSWDDQHAATDLQIPLWNETGAWLAFKAMDEEMLRQERWFYFDIRTEGKPF